MVDELILFLPEAKLKPYPCSYPGGGFTAQCYHTPPPLTKKLDRTAHSPPTGRRSPPFLSLSLSMASFPPPGSLTLCELNRDLSKYTHTHSLSLISNL
jgi:hypothetical protein